MTHFALPRAVVAAFDRRLLGLLLPPGTPADAARAMFATPPGEPALCPPDGVSWRVFANPLVVFAGGVSAVLMQLAEPRVRAGVWDHTRFKEEPLARMQRTALATMLVVYGPRSRTEAMVRGVNEAHRRVTGTTPGGEAYAASDQDLLAWVQVTATWGFMAASDALLAPLSAADRDACFVEAAASARLFGVESPCLTQGAAEGAIAAMAPRLGASPVVHEFLRIVSTMPALPFGLHWLQRDLVCVAVEVLPAAARGRLDLAGWRVPAWRKPLLRAIVRLAGGIALPHHPAFLAAERLER